MQSTVFTVLALTATILGAPQLHPDRHAVILKYDNNNGGEEGYNFGFETSNGISHLETGQLVNIGTEGESMVVRGQYSYVGLDGVVYTVTYVADENGFHPQGAHIPR
ncbi:flexible cuticle protein 12-like [Photinus pyralis]|uniref:flexible cuticle protein 12-like n=1 Tax=Photinus pyralis TaxID=7054 RepID=UPI00126727BD|nr:flexible cuticle protein 12-like [Photinus pyralis]